jgi:hypothetical protein
VSRSPSTDKCSSNSVKAPMQALSAKLESFLPRGHSALIFAITMACYSWMVAGLIDAIVSLFHFGPPPLSTSNSQMPLALGVLSDLLVAPLLESLILVGAIELLRWLKSPEWLQVFLAAAILAGPHFLGRPSHALVAMPAFTIQAASYLYWKSTSWKKAFAVLVCIHALHNLIPAISSLSMHHASSVNGSYRATSES